MSVIGIRPIGGHPVSAERLRWRRSAAARLPALGLAGAAVQGLLYLAGSTRHDWAALTAWQILWVSFLGPVAIGLLAGLLGRRESRARGGGAWWRPISPRRAHVAQFVVLAGYAVALEAFVFFAAVPFGWIDGLGVPGPLGVLAAAALVQWASTLSLLALAHLAGRRFGLFAAVGLGLAWAVAGTLTAESASWWWQPWAWSVRALLPVIGTHANGIPLEPGEALLSASPWPPALLSVALAVPIAVLGGGLVRGSGAGRGRSTSRTRRESSRVVSGVAAPSRVPALPPGRGGVTLALLLSLRRTAIAPLIAVSGALVVVGLVLWPDPRETWQLTALLILPAGAALLPVLAWHATAPAWRILAARGVGARGLATRLLLLMGGVVTAFAAFSAAALLVAGLPVADAAGYGVLTAATGLLIATWHLWLTIRTGPGTALAAAAVGSMLAIVVGGTGLAGTLWPFVPWSWALTASTGYRMLACVPAALALSVALGAACGRAGQRAAARG